MSRVPFLIIDSVQNSDQRIPPAAQHSVQAPAKLLSRDFTGVSRTHCRYPVRVNDPGFETIHPAVKLDPFGMKIIRRQIRQAVLRWRKMPLVGKVVNCETSSGSVPPPFTDLLMLDEKRYEPRLPVMKMHNIRPERQNPRQMYDTL